jgi:hypothetical protein
MNSVEEQMYAVQLIIVLYLAARFSGKSDTEATIFVYIYVGLMCIADHKKLNISIKDINIGSELRSTMHINTTADEERA